MRDTSSTTRLGIALALQVAITVLDIAIKGSGLIIASAALLVPFTLAVIGTERETRITAVIAFAIGIGSLFWNDTPGTGSAIYRIVFYGLVALLTVVAARARERATTLAQDLDATQARLDGILGSLGEAVTVHDETGKTVYANGAAAQLLGCPVAISDLPGRRLMKGEQAADLLTRSIRTDTGEAYWLLTKATLTEEPNGNRLAINIIEDVTDAKDAELRERFLAEAGQVLASSLDYEATLERVARMIVPRLADWCGIDMLDDHGDMVHVAVAHVDPAKVQMAHDLSAKYPPDMDAPNGVPAILRGGPAELYREIPNELLEQGARDEEHLRIIRELGMRSAMAVPMRLGDETLGVITLVSAESGRTYDDDDLAFAEDLALRAATAVQNSRLYEAQERVAHTLQASLLPDRLPELPGWEVHAAYQAGERGADVGGDFYDVLSVTGGHLVVLGDVTGKGIEAAALTSLVRHSARMAARFDPRPERVLSHVNEVLREQSRLSLVTAVCALIEEHGDRARVTVASAGHPLPLLRRGSAAPQPFGDHGVLLGVDGQDDWTEQTVMLAPGDTMLFYTDGVTETPGDAARFGELRLREAMTRASDGPVALLAEIDRSLRDFQAGATLDDRAMLALRFVGVPVAVT
jgi:serine phosphatase RsbU (regulator of sigma subunit)/PAS domain-containing protein